MNLSLYPWQNECLDAWFANDCRGLVNVVTGAGKTVLALAAIARLKPGLQEQLRVKIVVPTTYLLSQWRISLMESHVSPPPSRDEIGYYYGSRKDSSDRNYMIYVINSARYALARHILNDLKDGCSVLLIADECHHYTGRENRKIFDFLPFINEVPGRYYSLGLSATPETPEYESVLVPALGREIYRYGFSDAVEKKTIAPFAVFQIALSFNEIEQDTYFELSSKISTAIIKLTAMCPSLKNLDSLSFFGMLNRLAQNPQEKGSFLANSALVLSYQRKTLLCNASSRLLCACRLISLLDPKAKIILFGERIDQADEIYRLLSEQHPGQVVRCHSKMGKQTQNIALERYRNGEARILISCRALDEGFDIPAANVGIVLSCASVERQRIQRLGRILRRKEGKTVSCLYYLYVEESIELSSFIPHMPDEAFSYRLVYHAQNDAFSFPDYEDAAARVLQMFKQASSDRSLWKEAEAGLMKGMLRSDWLLGKIWGKDAWEEKISLSKTVKEKNYWICMRHIGLSISVNQPSS